MSETLIHPTAVVHPAARLGVGVRLGPYAVIEGPAELGDGCEVAAHAILTGIVRLGRGCRVGHGAVVGGWPQDLAFQPETASSVEIGEQSVIREHCTIHRGTAPESVTSVGSHCLLMAGTHLGHNARVGDHVIAANNVLLGGYVEIGSRVFIGGGSVFHQFVRVGRGAMIQGLSALSKDVPPFTLAAERNAVYGLNVVGLRRAGMSAGERAEIKTAFRLLYGSGRNVAQALVAAREQVWGAAASEFWAFAASAGKRGLCGRARASGAPGGQSPAAE